MIAFLATVVNIPGVTGPYNIGFPFLTGMLAIALVWRRGRWDACAILGLAFLAYAAASLLWTTNLPFGLEKFYELATLGMAYVYGSSLTSLRSTYAGFGLGLGISALVAIAQSLGFQAILQTSLPGGLFGNSSILAQCAGIALVPLVMEGLWWIAPGPMICMLLGQSRAAFAAVGIALILTVRWWLGLIAIGALILVGSNELLPLREWGLYAAGKAPDIRLEIWNEILRYPNLWGFGLGSFRFAASTGWAVHAHNDYLELWSELGIGAAPLFAMLVLALEGEDRTAQATLLAFLVVAFFAFPTWIPATGFMAAVVTGHLARLRPMGILSRNRQLMEVVNGPMAS